MRITSFSPVVPYRGIPHAGGEYVWLHLQALLESGHSVAIVAPRTPENGRAAAELPEGCRAVLVGDGRGTGVDLRSRLRPAMPNRRWALAVRNSTEVRAVVADADLLEYQWTQTAQLHRSVGRWSPDVPSVAIAHDVLKQLSRRQAARTPMRPVERAARRMRARVVEIDERRILRRMAAVLAFSPKDATLLHGLKRGGRIDVIAPPLEPDDPRWSEPRHPGEADVLFVGAFDREENADAADWLLESIWPRVLAEVPQAELHLVGTGPTARMRAAAEGSRSVFVSGYVDDLIPWYQRATVAVVPLRLGAGVKFKSVMAMLWGVPLVATGIGIEGIAPEDSDVFVAVSDDAETLAAGIRTALRGTEAGARARAFATDRYGRERFRADLDRIYRAVSER